MKKKFLSVLAVACVACLSAALLAGCSQQQSSSNDGNPADNKLIVGFDNSYPPYGFMDENNNPTGFDLDLAQEVASRNGWDIELSAIDWDTKDAQLNQGTINCIWNGFTMEGREDDYTFSEPYMLNEQVVVVKKNSGINSLSDLKGKTVMTQVDSAALDVLEGDQKALADTFKGGKAQTIGDYNNAFLQLNSGAVDAVACDLSIAQYQIAASPDSYVQLSDALSTEHYGVGFKKGDTEMADAVTKTLKEMYADGTVKTVCEKYAQYGLSYDNWLLK